MEKAILGKSLRGLLTVIQAVLLIVLTWHVLFTDTKPLEAQPFPDSHSYVREAIQIAQGDGFKVDFDERVSSGTDMNGGGQLYPSRYPPGLSVVLAPFALIAGESGVFFGSRLIIAFLLVATWMIARQLGGRIAGLVASGILFVSPFPREAATVVLSDAPGALMTLGIVLLIIRHTKTSSLMPGRRLLFFMGVIAGFALLTRLSLVVLSMALVAVFPRPRYLKWIALGFAPLVIFLMVYQWVEFGSPLTTGYDFYLPSLREFEADNALKANPFSERAFIFSDRLDGRLMEWTCPCDEFGPMGKASNAVFYPAVLLGLYWVYIPPVIAVFAVKSLWKWRSDLTARFSILVVTSNLLMMIFYFYQGARLVSPAAFLLVAYTSVGMAEVCRKFVTLRSELRPVSPAKVRSC